MLFLIVLCWIGLVSIPSAWGYLIVQVKPSINSNETLKICLQYKAEDGRPHFLYTYTKISNKTYSFKNGQLAEGYQPLAYTDTFNKCIFEYKFEKIDSSHSGYYPLFVVALKEKQEPTKFDEIHAEKFYQTIYFRSSYARSWEKLLKYLNYLKDKNPRFISAIYTARLLAVYHPEIYLQADNHTIQMLLNLPDVGLFYKIHPEYIKKSKYISNYFWNTNKSSAIYFNLDMVNLQDFETINEYLVYPEPIPYLNWFDRRILPIHFLLRMRKKFEINKQEFSQGKYRITPLEKAFLVYFKKKYSEYINAHRMFILYSLSGEAYIYANKHLYDINNNLISPAHIKRPIILVFNEYAVWYPLFDRDDTKNDSELQKVISRYGFKKESANFKNILSQKELKALTILKENTKFTDPKIRKILSFFAENQWYTFLTAYEQLNNISFKNDPYLYVDSSFLYPEYILSSIIYGFHLKTLASIFSPFTDYLSQILTNKGYESFSQEFLRLSIGRGEIFSPVMAQYTIDQGLRADLGSSKDISSYISAILEFSDKIWIRLHGMADDFKHHHWFVYVLNDDLFLDNGYILPYNLNNKHILLDHSPYSAPDISYDILSSFETFDGFTQNYFPQQNNYYSCINYVGSYSLERFKEILDFLINKNNQEPLYALLYDCHNIETPFLKVPFDQVLFLIKDYQENHFNPHHLFQYFSTPKN